MRPLAAFGALALAVTLVGCGRSTTPPPAPAPEPGAPGPAPAEPGQARPAGRAGGNAQRPGGQGQGEGQPRPYAQVITAGATTRDGLFKTHVIGTKLLFEIPGAELGRELLVVTRAARVPVDMGYGGQQIAPTQVVRWERIGHRVVLRSVSYETVADSSNPIFGAVRNSNNDIVIAAFDVEAYGPDSAPVVDVTRLYTAPPRELGPGTRFRTQPDGNRSFVERVLAFPTNVEVEATVTYPAPAQQGGQSAPSNPFAPNITETASLLLHWSMVKLPEQPMMPRLADRRIGFFSIRQLDYGRPEQRAEERRYIVRWRLEKKDPNAAISEPVKPIEYYVDPATPEWLKPWVKSGIEAWQPAFEAAGFQRAIVAKDAPTPQEDPDWSPEDARYSVVRWFPSTIENAQGPHVRDPRTGEIIESDIYMYHNIMNLQRSWYFTQVGHLDPRARQWPYPDSLMGKLVEFVVAHEVGHTLGYQHDQKGSSTYPVDSVRSRTWVKRMGHAPSIMDYSRFNYTAQPEDRIDLADLIPRIGPWDIYTTRWGYTPIPAAKTPDDEWAALDRWSREQDSVPWYRFSLSDSRGADPGDHTEAVGDDDPVKATGWGIQSIKQIVPLLVPATVQDGDTYDDLDQMYGRLIQQWRRELGHVAIIVGGAQAQEKYAGQDGARYRPWPRARQREAVRFLNANAFATPSYFLVDDILRRIEVEGALSRINAAQAGVLNTLFNDRRLERLVEFDALAGNNAQAYRLTEMLGDVRGGIWSELAGARVVIDPFRRELQRSYLAAVERKLNPPAPPSGGGGGGGGFGQQAGPARSTSDVRAAFRSEVRTLEREIAEALPKAGDRMTRAHLEDARDQIREMLEPNRGAANR